MKALNLMWYKMAVAVAWVLLPVGTASCGDDDVQNVYSSYRAYFRYDNVMSVLPLYPALTGLGEYCTISAAGSYLYFRSLTKSQQVNLTAVAYYQKYVSIAGFIVGRMNVPDMNTGAVELVAYDLACPNCYADDYISRPLTLKEGGFAYCSRCKRTYNLNDAGLISSGEKGRKLERYRISYSGSATVEIRNRM